MRTRKSKTIRRIASLSEIVNAGAYKMATTVPVKKRLLAKIPKAIRQIYAIGSLPFRTNK